MKNLSYFLFAALVLFITMYITRCSDDDAYADSSMVFRAAGSLTGLSDVGSSTPTAGNLLIGNGTNFQSVAVSGTVALTSAGVLTRNEDKPILIAATSYTSPSYRVTNAGTLNSITCSTDTGTATIDFQQCISTQSTGCNTMLSASITCDSNGESGTIDSGATAITANNWIRVRTTATSGSPTFWSVTPNIKQ